MLQKELKKTLGVSDITEYFSLESPRSCLDGDFTSDELRRIADAIEKLSSEEL